MLLAKQMKGDLIPWAITIRMTLARQLKELCLEGELGGDLQDLFFLNLSFRPLFLELLLPF